MWTGDADKPGAKVNTAAVIAERRHPLVICCLVLFGAVWCRSAQCSLSALTLACWTGNQMNQARRMAVIGAGMAGLACAGALQRAGDLQVVQRINVGKAVADGALQRSIVGQALFCRR